jgi:hypothetical protein
VGRSQTRTDTRASLLRHDEFTQARDIPQWLRQVPRLAMARRLGSDEPFQPTAGRRVLLRACSLFPHGRIPNQDALPYTLHPLRHDHGPTRRFFFSQPERPSRHPDHQAEECQDDHRSTTDTGRTCPDRGRHRDFSQSQIHHLRRRSPAEVPRRLFMLQRSATPKHLRLHRDRLLASKESPKS